jgi:hypothetical protein
MQPGTRIFLINNQRFLFYSIWIFLGLIQSSFTELQDDEAYYWVYSKFFDWGYVDHPPMTGLLIKMGYSIFPNELGVRFFPLLLNTFSLLIIEKLLRNKNLLLFYGIVLSLAVLQISGFVAVPDIPLIFFTALFFLFYKKFIDSSTLLNALLLGLCIALLLYSKYHAVLIVFFTLLSNLRLLTRYQTWIAATVALILFIPHLWWQYQHDWISFRYHLFESNVNPYKISYTTEYLLGQLLLAGPIAGILLLPAAFLYKPTDKTEKALKFTLIGIYLFFFLSSFRGRVEANWTAPVMVPLLVLAHQFFNTANTGFARRGHKLLFRLLPITLILVMFARVVMIIDVIPLKAIKQRYHAWKDWPAEMKRRTGGLPIVISSSYQRSSKYWFYSGQWTHSQNALQDGRNNFNFWPTEDSVLGKAVYYLDIYRLYRFPDSLKTPIGWVGYGYDPMFLSFAKVTFNPSKKKYKINAGDSLDISAEVIMPEKYRSFLSNLQILNDTISVGIFDKKGFIKFVDTPLRLNMLIRESSINIKVQPQLLPGKYYFRFSIRCGEGNSTHNSNKINLEVQ